MALIDIRYAFMVLYYMTTVDGRISPEEIERFNKIGAETNQALFQSCREPMIAYCQSQLRKAESEEKYEYIQEYVDAALDYQCGDLEKGMFSRQLVWNMLSIATSDNQLNLLERKLIRHVTRKLNFEPDIYPEMEQLALTWAAINRRLQALEHSSLPYAEIRPIYDELERRQENIRRSITELIADEAAQ